MERCRFRRRLWKVFDKATTGPLPFRRWHENDALHREYSKAVGELMERFMKEHSIKAEQMTPDQARSVLKANCRFG